jgi:dolichol-phosphate mannosyltransferase
MAAPGEAHGAPQVTVVLPTFNEAGNIGSLIAAILSVSAVPTEVLVVDDDSPDGTWHVAGEVAERDPRVRVIRREGERGLTSAIWHGVCEARGGQAVWMDCDFSMPPALIPALIGALEDADIAVGSRYAPDGADRRGVLVAVALSWAINRLAALVLGRGVRDYTSGFIAARRDAVLALGLRGDYGEYCIDLLARAQRAGYRLREVGYECRPREAGSSKTATNLWGFVRRGRKYLWTVTRLAFSS